MSDALHDAMIDVSGDVAHCLLQRDARLAFNYVGAIRGGRAAEHACYASFAAAGGGEAQKPLLSMAALERWRSTTGRKESRRSMGVTIRTAANVTEMLDADSSEMQILSRDEEIREAIVELVELLGGDLGGFVEQQTDLSSVNALVRAGVVKQWLLPGGLAVVSKRANPHKPGRFLAEQELVTIARERLGGGFGWCQLGTAATSGDIVLNILPAAILVKNPTCGRLYAISRWLKAPTMEEILMTEGDLNARRLLLRHARLILDALLDIGVLWHDMSPRNILVDKRGNSVCYHLVDFEKGEASPAPIGRDARAEFCRGQIGVEEFGVVCCPEEVALLLEGYYDPTLWQLSDERHLGFAMRPELAALFSARKISAVNVGAYNDLDLAVAQVRRPRVTERGRWYPGHIGFRLEHYLSCAGAADAHDYDRKATEVLLAAEAAGNFDEAALALDEATRGLETAAVLEDLISRAGVGEALLASEAAHTKRLLDGMLDNFLPSRLRGIT